MTVGEEWRVGEWVQGGSGSGGGCVCVCVGRDLIKQ